MSEVIKVDEAMVPQVRQFLAGRREFRYTDNWDPIFNYDWKLQKYPYGFALMEDGKILGFLASIFAERTLNGKKVIVCNIGSWVVDKSCPKGSGRSLLKPLLEMNIPILALTPNPLSTSALLKTGFQTLEQERVVFPLITSALAVNDTRRAGVSFEKEYIREQLSEADRKILIDHSNLNCVHFLIQDKTVGRYCYGVGTTSIIKRIINLKCFNLCYLSDAAFFADNVGVISKHLRRRHKFDLFRYDARLIKQRLSPLDFRMPRMRYLYSNGYDPRVFDNLYTELVTYDRY